MKFRNCSLLLLCFTLFVASCSKDGSNGVDGTNGTDGTNGANGANGANGTNGTNGKDGKTTLTKTSKEPAGANCTYGGTKFETGLDANNNGTLDSAEVITTQTKYVCNGAGAIYSSWIDVNVSDTLKKLTEERDFNYKQLLPAEALTIDIVNKGTVLMYYKNRNGVIFPVDRADSEGIIDSDTASASVTFNFYPGFVFKEKYLSFLGVGGNMAAINDNGSAVRYVLVPGFAPGRSIADLKKMPYGELAKLYNIED
jgi:hypothetical protein